MFRHQLIPCQLNSACLTYSPQQHLHNFLTTLSERLVAPNLEPMPTSWPQNIPQDLLRHFAHAFVLHLIHRHAQNFPNCKALVCLFKSAAKYRVAVAHPTLVFPRYYSYIIVGSTNVRIGVFSDNVTVCPYVCIYTGSMNSELDGKIVNITLKSRMLQNTFKYWLNVADVNKSPVSTHQPTGHH